MLHGWAAIIISFAYFGFLFALATFGDRVQPGWMSGRARPYIYAFSIAVYCTSWTFFGSVGLATKSGLEFLAAYLGPIIAFAFASPLLLRIVRLAKAQNITSIADFIAARYGKSQSLAVVVSLGAVLGAVPYIALQLKAISASLAAVLDASSGLASSPAPDIALWVALLLAAFSILFGTRKVDATEHQSGLMLAIAVESAVKLAVFLLVGAYVTWGLFDGPSDLFARAQQADLLQPFERMPPVATWITIALLSFASMFLLPRQFHVTIVESSGEHDTRHAIWLVPLYMLAINVFVIPLALAGQLMLGGTVDPDMYVLALPLSSGAPAIAMMTLLGGFSAATAMVIVETVAISIMLSNNVAIPIVLRYSERGPTDMRRFLLVVRRASILGVLLLAYAYHRLAGEAGLAQIGLISFAAAVQLAPAFFGGLFWRKATARGALLGIAGGLMVWAYTLLLPGLGDAGLATTTVITDGAFGLSWLRPHALFGLQADPLVHGVFWSLAVNVLAYLAGSVISTRSPMERLQASAFVGVGLDTMAQSFRGWHAPVRVGELQSAVARYLGVERTAQAFASFEDKRSTRLSLLEEADIHLIRYAEHLLASSIGASSSRLVLSLLLRRRTVTKTAALKLLDDASAAIQYSRDLMQTALDHARQGMVVFDSDLRLVCWNREYVRMFDIPPGMLKVGAPLDAIIRSNAERGIYGPGSVDEHVAERLEGISDGGRTYRILLHPKRQVIEVRADAMPDGGMVTTMTDITTSVEAERALEERVNERTRELTNLNQQLARAKAEADTANFSKTRFLAAASHDILQPLNAARLYVSSLAERVHDEPQIELVSNVDASLQSVEEIFSALLDISRLDAGALTPDISTFQLNGVLRQLEVEFAPLAKERNLELKVLGSRMWVRSDRRLLRRLLQNLVSNAIKYTPRGRVVVGCRRAGAFVRVEVRDTGLGIAASKQRVIFKEFQRLESGARVARGLGLGLSIVERVARILDHPLKMTSAPGRGSMFGVDLPVVAAPAYVTADPHFVAPPTSALLLAGTRVLCIDNEPAILEGMRLLLSGWGCRVESASGYDDAMARIATSGTPDVIIADYHLDQDDGLSAVARIRRALGDTVPAILLTADRGPAVREEARAQGFAVLHKPLRPAALRALLAQVRVARTAAE